MEWEYVTREWSFVDPVEDDWPRRREYAQLMLQQLDRKRTEREARKQASRGLGGIEFAAFEMPDPLAEDIVEGPEGDRLIDEYMRWRTSEESAYLNEFGAAGFELVSITRHRSPLGYRIPPVDVFAYFKRPRLPEAPPAPSRTIGFQMRQA
jgi:hypothetical protein